MSAFKKPEKSELKVVLDEKDFKNMVAGRAIRKDLGAGDVVHFILADIGFDRMEDALYEAVKEREKL
jgi:hypothetical protein